MSPPARTRGLLQPLVAWLALAAPAGTPADAQAAEAPRVVVQAQRQFEGTPWRPVTLPDWPLDPPVSPLPAAVRYRIALPAVHAAEPGVLLPGLLFNGTISFNGHLLRGTTDPQGRTLPRGLDRMAVLSLPAAMWRPQDNVLQIEALANPRMSVSRLEVGELHALEARHAGLVATRFIGPLVAGSIVGTLGLAMLALWARLREPTFALFAIGATAWTLVHWLPQFAWPSIGGVSYSIAWISLHGVVVAAFAAFCLRLAGWYRPRLERSLLLLAAAGPLLLSGAYALNLMDEVSSAWRLLLIAGIAVAFVSVCRAFQQTRSRASAAMVLCGGVALALAVHDWLADLDDSSNHPLLLSAYAGLMFACTAAALLVERYVRAARASAALNTELEARVAAQGAQLRQALREMESARDEARAADRAKSSFLAVASHDLRQPAHAIGLYLEALPRDHLSPRQAETLERLQASHHALERMFGTLLDMSQMDAGTLVPQRGPMAPWPLLQRLADEFAAAAETRGLRLAVRAVEPAAGARVDTDAVLLERMLRNLIGNALKYTVAGGVLLACRVRTRQAAPELQLQVWDTGVGIAPAQQAQVFEEFFRVQPARNAAEGLGLGLPIVRRLARLLDIRVGLRSRPGHGSCFWLALPLLQTTSGAPVAAAPITLPAPQQSLAGLRVAVLEDDAQVRDALCRVLLHWGCEVQAAASADELLAAQERGGGPRPSDVMVVDYALAAGRTGPAQAQAWAAATGTRPQVLVVTGEQSPERLRELAALGLPWLPKPVAPGALRQALAALQSAPREMATPHHG